MQLLEVENDIQPATGHPRPALNLEQRVRNRPACSDNRAPRPVHEHALRTNRSCTLFARRRAGNVHDRLEQVGVGLHYVGLELRTALRPRVAIRGRGGVRGEREGKR